MLQSNLKSKSVVFSLVGSIALASTIATTAALANDDKEERKAAATFLAGSEIKLSDAVKKAENQLGGQAFEAELEEKDGKFVYELELLKDGTVTEVVFNPANGELNAEKESFQAVRDWFRDDHGKMLQAVQISMVEAIAAAEQKTGGVAIEAELEQEDEQIVYSIDLLKDGVEYEVALNSMNGELQELEREDDDD